MVERRQDYIELAVQANDIKYMKKTLDKHTEDIAHIKDTQVGIASDIKDILNITNTRVKILEVKFKWIVAAIVAFFTSLGTILLLFGKKIAIALGILLP